MGGQPGGENAWKFFTSHPSATDSVSPSIGRLGHRSGVPVQTTPDASVRDVQVGTRVTWCHCTVTVCRPCGTGVFPSPTDPLGESWFTKVAVSVSDLRGAVGRR